MISALRTLGLSILRILDCFVAMLLGRADRLWAVLVFHIGASAMMLRAQVLDAAALAGWAAAGLSVMMAALGLAWIRRRFDTEYGSLA